MFNIAMHMTVLRIGSKSSLSIIHNKHKNLTLNFQLILTNPNVIQRIHIFV
jgi:antitoxin component HigA of HigAB toxin-antitoxin module